MQLSKDTVRLYNGKFGKGPIKKKPVYPTKSYVSVRISRFLVNF
jgi:hypothetical protein